MWANRNSQMRNSGRNSFTGCLVVALCFTLAGALAYCYYQPRIAVKVERHLVQVADEPIGLLSQEAPLAQIVEAIERSGKSVDQVTCLDTSLLSEAVVKRRKDVVAWALARGANPNGIIPSTNPLRYAIGNEDADLVGVLLRHGADPDLEMGGGMTPRRIAILGKNNDIAGLLRNAERKRQPESAQSKNASK